MTELKDLPRWLPKKKAMEEFGWSEDKLRLLRQEGKITARQDEGKGQFFYDTQSCIDYCERGTLRSPDSEKQSELSQLMKQIEKKEQDNKRKEELGTVETDEVVLGTFKAKWTEPDSYRRCRLNCGDGFVILEWRLKKGGYSYQLLWRMDGKPHDRRMDKKRAKDRDSAFKEYLTLRFKLAEGGEAKIEKEDITVAEGTSIFIESKKKKVPKTWGIYKYNIRNNIVPYFGEKKFVDIKFSDCEDYVDDRRDEGAMDSSINLELSIFRTMFNFFVEREYFSKLNPIKVGRLGLVSKPRTRGLSQKEQDELFAAIDEEHDQLSWDVVMFDLNTALRRKNVSCLKKEYVDFDEGTINIPGHKMKNGDDWHLTLNEILREILKRNIEQHPESEYVFATKWGGKWIRISNLLGIVHKYIKKAGIKHFTFHDLRRTAGRRFYLANNKDLLATSRFMGHRDIQQTKNYLGPDIDKDERQISMDRLGESLVKQPSSQRNESKE